MICVVRNWKCPVFLLSVSFTQALWADFADPTIRVPVERVISNLERDIKTEPKNSKRIFQLARAHAIAYAEATSTFSVDKRFQTSIHGGMPTFDEDLTKKGEMNEALRLKHLEQAVQNYKKGLDLDPTDYTARMSYGWCLMHSGNKSGALQEFRKTFDEALRDKGAYSSGDTIAAETAIYLQRLLDPNRDRAELERIKKQTPSNIKFMPTRQARKEVEKAQEGNHRMITPILVPLTSDVSFKNLVNRKAKVSFDLDVSCFSGNETKVANLVSHS